MKNGKKLLLVFFAAAIVALFLILAALDVFGAPNFSRQRSIEPETDATFRLASSTDLRWLTVHTINASSTEGFSVGTSSPTSGGSFVSWFKPMALWLIPERIAEERVLRRAE